MRHIRVPFAFEAPVAAPVAGHLTPQSCTAFPREARAHCRTFCESKAAHRVVLAWLHREVLSRNPLSFSETCRVARIMHTMK
jgi:hypothetical protein